MDRSRSNGWSGARDSVGSLYFSISLVMKSFGPFVSATSDVCGSDPPMSSLNTRRSVLSHETAPSTSYGFGCVVSVMTA